MVVPAPAAPPLRDGTASPSVVQLACSRPPRLDLWPSCNMKQNLNRSLADPHQVQGQREGGGIALAPTRSGLLARCRPQLGWMLCLWCHTSKSSLLGYCMACNRPAMRHAAAPPAWLPASGYKDCLPCAARRLGSARPCWERQAQSCCGKQPRTLAFAWRALSGPCQVAVLGSRCLRGRVGAGPSRDGARWGRGRA